MNKFLFLTIIFILVYSYCFAIESDYGLVIKAAPSPNNQKTTLVLENNLPLKLCKETTMSFNMLIRNEYLFGIVFRIITDRNENIDLMLTVNGEKNHPILVVNEQAHTVPRQIVTGQWIPVSITLSKTKKEILLTYGEENITIPHDLSNAANVRISFGTSSIESFLSSDIASVNIKDIRIFNDGILKRYWKLKEHKQNIILDSVANSPAIAVNPQWIIDINSTWKMIYSTKAPFNTQMAFDGKSKFFIVSPDSKNITLFDTTDKREDSIRVNSGYIVSNSPNTLFFDSLYNQLISYNLTESLISRYSFETNTWSSQIKSIKDPYLNNSAVFSPQTYSLYSFGGYEYYTYAHNLIRMNMKNGYQEKAELTEISPRFSTSSIIVNDIMYIFGGRGSKTGRQEIAPRNYYDFYSVDLLLEQAVKLWEETEIDEDFLPGANMIYDPEKNCFYLFTTKNGGTLLKIEAGKKGFEQMSFPIGINFDALFLFTNIYFSTSQQKLFALIYNQITKTEVDISIYSLDFPPVPIHSLSQTESAQSNYSLNKIVLIIGSLMLCGIIVFFLRKKKRTPITPESAENKEDESVKKTIMEHSTEKQEDEVQIQEKKQYDFSRSSVCFLNGFNVIDKKGNDITGQFTPTLKHLLILLILYTNKDGKGIHGNKLIQLLWFDKNEESAKKNRNVYFSKLRSTFESVGGIELANKNGYWSIKLDENITCDYSEAMRLFQVIKEDDSKDQTEINKLLELLLRGVLLPNTEIDWLDNFKSDFSNLTIDILLKLSQSDKYQLDDELRMKISDTLFLHDLINEEALAIKCSILFNSGKKGVANSVYTNFCKEYYNLLGVTYKYSLTDIINTTTHS